MPRWTPLWMLLLASWALPCYGVIILQKDNPVSIKGFLVSENDQRVVVDELLPNGETRQRVVQRAEIDVMIVSVAPERLAALNPEKPQDYRDYADELSEKREDPEARNAAIRLYLLAAHLDPAGQGRGALLSMAGLARSPAEERKFRAMVYLLDPAHDRSVLKPPARPKTVAVALTESEQTMLLTAIRALRSGNRREALNFTRRPLFQQVFQRFSSMFTLEAFRAAASQRTGLLPRAVQKKLLALELMVLGQPGQESRDEKDVPWSTLVTNKRDSPVAQLSLETITEFNPAETVFRDNRWTLPKDDA